MLHNETNIKTNEDLYLEMGYDFDDIPNEFLCQFSETPINNAFLLDAASSYFVDKTNLVTFLKKDPAKNQRSDERWINPLYYYSRETLIFLPNTPHTPEKLNKEIGFLLKKIKNIHDPVARNKITTEIANKKQEFEKIKAENSFNIRHTAFINELKSTIAYKKKLAELQNTKIMTHEIRTVSPFVMVNNSMKLLQDFVDSKLALLSNLIASYDTLFTFLKQPKLWQTGNAELTKYRAEIPDLEIIAIHLNEITEGLKLIQEFSEPITELKLPIELSKTKYAALLAEQNEEREKHLLKHKTYLWELITNLQETQETDCTKKEMNALRHLYNQLIKQLTPTVGLGTIIDNSAAPQFNEATNQFQATVLHNTTDPHFHRNRIYFPFWANSRSKSNSPPYHMPTNFSNKGKR